uniref:Nucleolar protein 56 n=1 Tax=Ditylenchus dipsaci TaxID=166011 RepID=A0A915EPE3_9BILA
MSEAPHFMLFEHAVGYTLFKVKEFEDIGLILPQVIEAANDLQRFHSVVQVHAFEPFKNTEAALENCNSISEGLVHADLLNFLSLICRRRKRRFCWAGIRTHFAYLAKDLPHHSLPKAQLSLGHSYSRSKVKFDIHRVDNMVIQSIGILDQLDKDINLFGMRIREWYAYHYPELFKLVPDLYKYVRCAATIMDRKKIDDSTVEKLKEILENDELVESVVEAARTSMGMEISELDLVNIEKFALRVASLAEYREQVAARLISHAGSLTNLAKNPASTIQILGAEKSLFRALKTRTNTPKYGLLFHSSFIGRASLKNKGRISRFLANKCSIASRIDCFSEVPVPTFGEHMRQQVEDRLKYFETGEFPKKNEDVMKEAGDDADTVRQKVLKRQKKAAKKAKKAKLESSEENEEKMEVEA